jgi:hypothetical protein
MALQSLIELEDEAEKIRRQIKSNAIRRATKLPLIDHKSIQQIAQLTSSCIRPALEKLAHGQTEFTPHSHPDNHSSFTQKLNKLAADAIKILNKHFPEKAKEWVASLQDALHEAMKKLPKVNPQLKIYFSTLVFSLVIAITAAIVSSRENDLTLTEILQEMLNSVFSTAAFGGFFELMRYLGSHQLIVGLKTITRALAIETFSSTLSLLASGLIGYFITILWDIFVAIHSDLNRNHSMMGWVFFICKSLFNSSLDNSLQLLACSTIALLCPAWATLLISFLVSIPILQLKETARHRNESIYFTASRATWNIIAFIPETLWYTLVGYPTRTSIAQYPQAFLCESSSELLEDPVFFRGYIVSRSVAQTRVERDGCDFHGLPATSADVIPIPTLKAIIEKFRRQVICASACSSPLASGS